MKVEDGFHSPFIICIYNSDIYTIATTKIHTYIKSMFLWMSIPKTVRQNNNVVIITR